MARILLGVSGGIAAYKSLELARLATLAGHGVRVLMTESADALRRRRLLRGDRRRPGAHLRVRARPAARRLPRRPARPSTTRSATSSWPPTATPSWSRRPRPTRSRSSPPAIADSMLTTSFLACAAPRLVAPAMNDRMYADAATQANLATLRERGVDRDRARGGAARLARRARPRPPARPGRSCWRGSKRCCPRASRPWDGLRVLVTAGGTREPIDPVRFIGNRSSGRMGIALAAAAARRGAEVTLIAANVALPEPAGVSRIDVETAAELAEAARGRFADRHVLLMAAAPADFRPRRGRAGKLKPRGRAGAAASSRPRTSSPASPPTAHRGPDDRRLRRRARRGRRRARPRKARAQGRRPDRPQRRLRPGDRLRERGQRGDPDRRLRRDRRAAGRRRTRSPEAILDRVDELRRKAPQRSSEPGYTGLKLFCP